MVDFVKAERMFQVMPPRGGIPDLVPVVVDMILFQVMPPRGGIQGPTGPQGPKGVSSHAPARGHRPRADSLHEPRQFQVMPPRGGIVKEDASMGLLPSFKSCPREGASTCK